MSTVPELTERTVRFHALEVISRGLRRRHGDDPPVELPRGGRSSWNDFPARSSSYGLPKAQFQAGLAS